MDGALFRKSVFQLDADISRNLHSLYVLWVRNIETDPLFDTRYHLGVVGSRFDIVPKGDNFVGQFFDAGVNLDLLMVLLILMDSLILELPVVKVNYYSSQITLTQIIMMFMV